MMPTSTFAPLPRGLTLLTLLCLAMPASGRPHPDLRDDQPPPVDGIHVIDGSYVVNAGNLQVNITNHGLIGSHYTDYQTYSNAPSAQWPGGTGDEYLYGAGLWIGARKGGVIAVTTGQPERELRPQEDILATIYEAERGRILRPTEFDEITGRRLPQAQYNDDRDSRFDEEILNGHDDDGDGRIDEDFAQIGDQMLVCTMHDDTGLVQEIYPQHNPLGVTVVQRAAAWSDDDTDDIVALDFEIHNSGFNELEDLYLGFYMDCDIQNRRDMASAPDDLSGFFNGAVRDTSGIFHRIQVAYMHDNHPDHPLPGWFGVIMLDHTTDYSGLRAPRRMGATTYRAFTTGASTEQGGEPLQDSDRYAVMSGRRIDRDAHENEGNDYKTLVATGPFRIVERDAVIDFRLALIIGDGFEEMMKAAMRASVIQRGASYDLDYSYVSGAGGRESVACYGDLPEAYGAKPFVNYVPSFMDDSCIGDMPPLGYPPIWQIEDENSRAFFVDDRGRRCIWVNGDNCEECYRYHGRTCTVENGLYWDMSRYTPWGATASHITGFRGREHRQPWSITGNQPPRPPSFRVVPGDGRVELFWDDLSEHIPDDESGAYDFESYRVWRIANWNRPAGVDEYQTPPTDMWGMIGEWDKVNYIPAGVGYNNVDLALGRNTGLAGIRYVPVCLANPRFEGVREIMQEIVDADRYGRWGRLPTLRLEDGTPRSGFEALLPWEEHEAELDTFFAVTARSGTYPKRAAKYYHWIDTDVHNNFRTYYALTVKDHTVVSNGWQWLPSGFGAESSPSVNYLTTSARQDSQTSRERETMGENIFVYPNPVTWDSLEEFDAQETTWDNPTGVQVVWANLPQANNTIRIYTVSGDLVQTLSHDGTGGDGTASWNLVSRNLQEITSGIYIYVVESDDSAFEDFRGYFTVIR